MRKAILFLALFGCLMSWNGCVVMSLFQKKIPVSFRGSQREIEEGGKVTLKWKVEGKKIQNIALTGMKDKLEKEGELVVRPDSSTVYELIVTPKKGDPIKKRYKVSVLSPEINYFIAPKNTTDEEAIVVKWSVRNAEKVSIEGFKTGLRRQDELELTLDTTTELRLIAENSFKRKAEKTAVVEVEILEEFNAPDEIYVGDTAFITWKFKRAKHVTNNHMAGKFNPIGHVKALPLETTHYRFTVTSIHNQKSHLDHTIHVLQPEIIYFSGSKKIGKGAEANLKWKVEGKARVKIVGVKDSLPKQGGIKIKPEKTTTYKLVMNDGKKEHTKQFTVKVVDERRLVESTTTVSRLRKNSWMYAEILGIDRSNYPEEIKVQVIMVDNKGAMVNGLAPPYVKPEFASNYFLKLQEEIKGKNYPISSFEIKEIHNKIPQPYDIAMVADNSGSVQASVVKSIEQALEEFIQRKNKSDNISVVKFDDTVRVEVPLLKDKEQILAKLKHDKAQNKQGNTALYAGADLGIASLEGATRKKIMLLLADGHENASFRYYGQRATTATQVIEKARSSGVRIHTIAYGEEINVELLKKISQYTDGSFYQIDKPSDIKRVFNEIPVILRNYYEITYKPREADGARKFTLTYNNIATRKTVATEIFIGDEHPNVNEYEYLGLHSYWEKELKHRGKHYEPLSPPQAVAFFNFNMSKLKDEYKPYILTHVKYLEEHKDTRVAIFGHTDSKGSIQRCNELAKERALTVKKFMVEHGIAAHRIEIHAKGKRHPIWEAEEHEWQKHENRRIEILLMEEIKKKPK